MSFFVYALWSTMGNPSESDLTDGPESSWTFRRVIPSDTSVGSVLINELIDAMFQFDWEAAEQFRVQLAYEEAIVNAIRHGNRNKVEKTVTVEMSCDQDRVWIRITDQGKGFDPKEVPDPRQKELLEVPGGRGVLLINEIMSEVAYNEQGNQITMSKIRGDKMGSDEA